MKSRRYRRLSFSNTVSDASEGEFLWLVSLSDLMILLFVFFVVLFSFSYKKMQAGDFENISKILKGDLNPPKKSPVEELEKKIIDSLGSSHLSEQVQVEKIDQELVINVREKILFQSGDSDLKSQSDPLLKVLSNTLKDVPAPYRIGVEGHTDDIPISNTRVKDNWQLSTERALSVLRSLQLEPSLMRRAVAMGYADKKPIVPNRDASGKLIPENQAKNRRVTIRVF